MEPDIKLIVDSLTMTRDSNPYIWGPAPPLIWFSITSTAFLPIFSKGWARAVNLGLISLASRELSKPAMAISWGTA